jgi:hypothetical protein
VLPLLASCISKNNTGGKDGKHPLSMHSSMSGVGREQGQEFPVLMLREISNTADTRTSPSQHPSRENTHIDRQGGNPPSLHHTLNILGNDSSQCGIVGNSGNGSSMSRASSFGESSPVSARGQAPRMGRLR